MKKLLVIVLALAMVLGMFSFANAEGPVTEFNATHVNNAMVNSGGKETSEIFEKEGSVEELTIYAGWGWMDYTDFDDSDIKDYVVAVGVAGVAPAGSDLLAEKEGVDGGNYGVGMQRWQWRAHKDIGNAYIVLTAKVDTFVDVYTGAIVNQWATGMGVNQYVVDADGIVVQVRAENVKDATDEHAFFDGVHLKKGDKLVIELTHGELTPGTNGVWPQFKVDASAYDATKRADFAAIKAFNDAKAKGAEDVNAILAGLKQADYSAANWTKINGLIETALEDVAAVEKADDIAGIVSAVKTKVDEVLTLAEEKAILDAEKADAKAGLAEIYKEEYYTKKNWELAKAELDKANAAIDAAKNSSEIKAAVAAAKTALDAVEVGGCGTTKQAEAGIVLGGLAAAIVVFTKKREN